MPSGDPGGTDEAGTRPVADFFGKADLCGKKASGPAIGRRRKAAREAAFPAMNPTRCAWRIL